MSFLDFFRRRPAFTAELAPGIPFAAIGDVHGRLSLLERLLAQVEADLPQGAPIVLVGDYVDRGEDSAGVLRHLRALQAARGADRIVCLMGNHEAMLIDTLDRSENAGRRWVRHGGRETLMSFRLDPPADDAGPDAWEALSRSLADAIGAEGVEWLRGLPRLWQTGNVAVVHAGADPYCPLESQADDRLVWGHPDFRRVPRTDGVWVVHGHTIVDAPTAEEGCIAVDTGAYLTGCLTAALILPGEVRFVQA